MPSLRETKADTPVPGLFYIFQLAIPIFSMQALQVGMVIMTSITIGQIDPIALSAIGIASGYYSVLSLAGIGFISSSLPLISIALGQGSRTRAGRWFRHCVILGIIVGLIGALVCNMAHPILESLGIEGYVLKQACDYLYGAAFALIPFYLYVSFRCLSIALQQTAQLLKLMLCASILQAILLLGISKYCDSQEVAFFAGLSMTSTWWFLIAISWLSAQKDRKNSDIINLKKPYSLESFKRIVHFGLPMSARVMLSEAAPSVSLIIVANRPATEIFYHVVAVRVSRTLAIIGLSLGSVVMSFTGNMMGSGRYREIDNLRRKISFAAFFFILVPISIWVVFPEKIAFIFGKKTSIYENGNLYSQVIIVCSIYILADGLQSITNSVLTGMSKPVVALIITSTTTWFFGIGLGLIFIKFFQASILILWICIATGSIFSFVAGLLIINKLISRKSK